MAKSLTTAVLLKIAADFANGVDLGAADYPLNFQAAANLANGTGNGQANQIFTDERTIAASGSENLDLAGGLTDVFGASITFTKIKLIAVLADAANTNTVVVGGAASNGFATPFGDATDTIGVQPGGFAVLFAPNAGFAVTADTGDLLKVANGGGSTGVTYKVLIVGVA